jgi:hypothetical protein
MLEMRRPFRFTVENAREGLPDDLQRTHVLAAELLRAAKSADCTSAERCRHDRILMSTLQAPSTHRIARRRPEVSRDVGRHLLRDELREVDVEHFRRQSRVTISASLAFAMSRVRREQVVVRADPNSPIAVSSARRRLLGR